MKQLRAQLLHLRLGSPALLHRGDLALRPSERQESNQHQGQGRGPEKDTVEEEVLPPAVQGCLDANAIGQKHRVVPDLTKAEDALDPINR
jgi:hypothetical protein